VVADVDLGDAGAFQAQQGGPEAVHALPGRDAPQVLGAADAQGAADVGDRLVGEAVPRAPGLPGR
jgi:hypothetical protein